MVNETSNAKNWKYKYLEALDEQEKREQSWQQEEQTYRHGLGRLALISQGADTVLDRRLTALRKALQKDLKVSQIESLLDEVSERVKILDDVAESSGISNPLDVLSRLLEAINVPKVYKTSVRKLQKRLASSSAGVDVTVLLADVVGVLNLALMPELVDTDNESFFGKLFGNKNKASATLTGEPMGQGEGLPAFAGMSYEENERLLNQVFTDVLEGLPCPPEFSSRVQELKEALTQNIDVALIKYLTKGVVSLVVDMRRALMQEKGELEDFLQQLTDRLNDLTAMLDGAETHRKASLESSRHLDAMVNAQVSDIEEAVNTSTELGQLKTNIQGSLDSIRRHFSEQRDQEDSRQAEMEEQMAGMTERLQAMESETETLKKRITLERQQAMTDPLTGAPNRLAYEKNMAQEFARWQRYKHDLSLMVLDIDFFKKVNDTFGHQAGDRALKAIVNALKQHVRTADFMARIGGEEFVLVMPETSLEGGAVVAEKIRRGIEASEFVYKGQPVAITVSGGVAQFREGDSPDEVYVRADKALYRAKEAGRNQFQLEK